MNRRQFLWLWYIGSHWSKEVLTARAEVLRGR